MILPVSSQIHRQAAQAPAQAAMQAFRVFQRLVYTCVHVYVHAVPVIAAEILLLNLLLYLAWLIK